ncbi:U-box domain-containing protein 34-like [Ziziphus jujuba]|uniref:RING-type E3 ubiquitin transferase n=1 Tax=Ziziphus jujuba TaxID=326968 RepID=A0ABM3IAU9_ZIZJJ|nr:U-box domain-containing protein 34-like [Ziziphus jujuba]
MENSGITLVAIDKDKNSQHAVKWAVDNLMYNKRNSDCILIHVQDIDTVPKEGRPPTEAELKLFFLPYRGYCARKGVNAKEVVLHDIDVPSALVDYVFNNPLITNIVVGASNRSSLMRKFRESDVPTSMLKSAPESCNVYVISKGKVQTSRSVHRLQSIRSGASTSHRQRSQNSQLPQSPTTDVTDYSTTSRASSNGSNNSRGSSDGMCLDRNGSITNSPRLSINSSSSGGSSIGNTSPKAGAISQTIDPENLDLSPKSSSPRSPVNALEAEMRRLKLELKHTMEMYNSACKEALAAKRRAEEYQQLKSEEERKLEEARLAEEAAMASIEEEKQKTKAAMEAAQMAQRLADIESKKRKIAEIKAKQEEEDKNRAMNSKIQNSSMYRRYNIQEIEVATDYFKETNKIGEGGYGPVFRGLLDHTPVAIKVLRPDISQGLKQFQQEVEILSCIRHPHMVILVGACPEYGCLVYEYMDNGSLEDRLFRKDESPPIPLRTRFKIASEIATALLFLHQRRPEPLVHRDLKPANILLDQHYVSKISDVGLARLVPPSVADNVTQYRLTAAAGTFCYIDPEYQQTGMLGVKSDIYSLGVILLQIITAKPPMGLSHRVGEAIEKGKFSEMLDPALEDWPIEDALALAKLGLKCCELRKKDRPDLSTVILPELNRLRDLGMQSEASSSDNNKVIPRHHRYGSDPGEGNDKEC